MILAAVAIVSLLSATFLAFLGTKTAPHTPFRTSAIVGSIVACIAGVAFIIASDRERASAKASADALLSQIQGLREERQRQSGAGRRLTGRAGCAPRLLPADRGPAAHSAA